MLRPNSVFQWYELMPVYQVRMQAVMIVVRVQTVFGAAEKGWREGTGYCGLEGPKKVAGCAKKF